MTLSKVNRISAIVILLFSVSLFAYTTALSSTVAIYPRLILSGLVILSIALFLTNKKPNESDKPSIENIPLVLLILFVSIIYITLVNFLGYYISSFIYIVSVMLVFKIKKIKLLLGVSLIFILTIYIGFTLLLNIPIPTGILGGIM